MFTKKWLILLVFMTNLLYANTSVTTISRLQLDHPDLGYDGGASLHTAVANLFQKIGDNMNSRYNEYSSVPLNTVTTVTHNFGVAFSELKVLLYTNIGNSKTRISSPTGSGWTIAANGTNPVTQIDVTTPNSAGPYTFTVVIVHGKGAEQLSDLSDIDFSTPAQDGQALVFNGTSSKWLPGASGDSSLKCQSISTPNLVMKAGYLFLDNGSELQVATDLTVSLSTILGSAPANATSYYLYADLDNIPSATLLSNGRSVRVVSAASNFSLQTALPTAVNLTRYVPLCLIQSATTGTAWSGTGSSFVTLATRRANRPSLNVSPTVYSLSQQAVGTIGSANQIAAGHILTSASFPTFTTNLSFYNLTGLTDGSGNARSLTNNGTVPFTGTNLFGTTSVVATFNGTSQSLSSTSTFFNPGNNNSIAMGGWFKATSWTPAAQQYLITQHQSSSDQGFGAYIETNGDIHFFGTNTANAKDTNLIYPNPGFSAGSWHHIVWVYNFPTTTLKGFVDGALVVSGFLANIRGVTSPFFQIGAVNGTPSLWLAGSAEEVFFTTLAVLDEDVRRTYSFRVDHSKNVTVANQKWDAIFAGNLTSELNKDWLVNINANSVYWDFSELQSTDQVSVTMANKSFTTTTVPIYTFTTGKLIAAPTFPLNHNLGAIPKDFYVLTTGQSLSGQDDKRYDLCSATSTQITCDLSSLTIDSSHTIEIVASAAPIAVSVPLASPTNSGTVTSYTPNAGSKVKIVSSANYTILDGDGFSLFLVTTGASDRTITLPSVTATGREITIKKVDSGAGKVIITPASGNIDGASTNSLLALNANETLISDGTNWNVTRAWDFVQSVQTSDFNQSSPTSTTFYDTSAAVTVPPGNWEFTGQCVLSFTQTASTTNVAIGFVAIRVNNTSTLVMQGGFGPTNNSTVTEDGTITNFSVSAHDTPTTSTTYRVSIRYDIFNGTPAVSLIRCRTGFYGSDYQIRATRY